MINPLCNFKHTILPENSKQSTGMTRPGSNTIVVLGMEKKRGNVWRGRKDYRSVTKGSWRQVGPCQKMRAVNRIDYS